MDNVHLRGLIPILLSASLTDGLVTKSQCIEIIEVATKKLDVTARLFDVSEDSKSPQGEQQKREVLLLLMVCASLFGVMADRKIVDVPAKKLV